MDGLAASVVLLAILLGILLLVAFDVLCLVHLTATSRVRFLPRFAWAVVIVCISPIGGLVYLVAQRVSGRSVSRETRLGKRVKFAPGCR
jgi:hypothetical protein